MTDWTADDILTGASAVPSLSDMAARKQAMREPASVSLVVVGKNGHTVTHRVLDHEGTALSVTTKVEQEVSRPQTILGAPVWGPPRWKLFTWEVRQDISYRAEDFLRNRP